MVHCYKCSLALSIAGLVFASYGGEFTLKKAEHDFLLKNQIVTWEMTAGKLEAIPPKAKLNVPGGLVEPKVKCFYSSATTPILLLVYKSSRAAKSFDRVIIDHAGNRDFTHAPVLTCGPGIPVDVKLPLKGQAPVDYRLYLVTISTREGPSSDVALLPMLWREGTVTVAGKQVRAVMWSRQALLLDYDGDGQLNLDPETGSLFEVLTYMRINGGFYKTVCGTSDNELDFEPWPSGKVALTGEMIPKGSTGGDLLELGGSEEAEQYERSYDFLMLDASYNQPIVVPSGKHGYVQGCLLYKDGHQYYNFRVNNVTIRPEHVTTLNIGEPTVERLSVDQKGRTLSVTRELVFTGNPEVLFAMIPEGESNPPTVEVVDAADPAKVIVGRKNMEYG